MMDNCIFCKIVAGEIPATKIYEDDDVLAFLDITQVTKGHTLLIPKKHYRNVLAMSAAESAALFANVPVLGNKIVKALGAEGMNIIANNEEIAGQSVFHTHIHLLPRYPGDAGPDFSPKEAVPHYDLDSLAAQIKGESR